MFQDGSLLEIFSGSVKCDSMRDTPKGNLILILINLILDKLISEK
jgi:hypothetical protein